MLKKMRLVSMLLCLVALVATLSFVSCAAVSSTSEEVKRMPATVEAIPNVGLAKASNSICGANFQPGEKLKVVILLSQGPTDTEQVINPTGNIYVTADEHGTFKLAFIFPEQEGIWPIRVYDAQGNMLAGTLVVVQPPPKK